MLVHLRHDGYWHGDRNHPWPVRPGRKEEEVSSTSSTRQGLYSSAFFGNLALMIIFSEGSSSKTFNESEAHLMHLFVANKQSRGFETKIISNKEFRTHIVFYKKKRQGD